jgi:formate hydrogenlyase transcriptional activator
MVSAEIARIHGRSADATTLYEAAITAATTYERARERALANELYARRWLERGQQKVAAVFMAEARSGYARWGASADEIGELSLETQVKLLRVLQEQEFEPVGSSRTVRVDVRVIAATNRDLEEAVRAGRFRSDLFYRLNVFPIQVPPLRERRSDIPLLVMFFLSRFAKKLGKKVEAVPQGIMDLLTAYDWPGNIRELQNLIERAVVLSQGPVLRLDRALLPAVALDAVTTPSESVGDAPGKPGRDRAGRIPSMSSVPGEALTLEEVERHHILRVLQQTRGVIEGQRGASKILNLHPNTLRSRIKKLRIKHSDYDIS